MRRYHRFAPFAALMATLAAAPLEGPLAAQRPHDLYQQALRKERADGDLASAIALYSRVLAAEDRALAARALIRIAGSYERLGRPDAREAYERVLRDYPDQSDAVGTARARLTALDQEGGAASSHAYRVLGEADLRLRLVWEDPGVDVEGQPTSDGRHLTFVDWESGDLAVRDLEAGTHRRITNVGYPHYALQSAVSNDDGRVAYFWTGGDAMGWQPQLRVIGMDGTGERTLIANENLEIEYIAPYAWTPDDRSVLVELTRAGSWDIALTDAHTGEVRVVRTLTNGGSSRLTMSPDGRWIAYDEAVDRANQYGDRNVHVVAADGSRSFVVADHPATDLHPIFTPDGSHLLFTSNRGGSVDLWAVRLGDGDAGEPMLVKRALGAGATPMGFAADGALFYARDTGGGDIYAAPFDSRALRVTGDGTKRVRVFEGYNSGPSWSPGADRIAYTSRRNHIGVGNSANLIIMDTETGREIQGPEHVRFHRKWTRPMFAPDGRTIVAAGSHRGEAMMFAVDPETGRERALAPAPGGRIVGWDPDGGSFYYTRFLTPGVEGDHPRAAAVFRYDFSEQRASEVRELPGYWKATGRISPDHRTMAWLVDDGPRTILRVAPLRGGAFRDLYVARRPVMLSQSASVAWTPDSRHILVATSRGEGWVANKTREVLAIPADGGDPAPVGLAASELRHLSVFADGTAIGYAAGHESHNEVWVIENLLPVLRQR